MVTENIKFLLSYLRCLQNLRKKILSHREWYFFIYFYRELYLILSFWQRFDSLENNFFPLISPNKSEGAIFRLWVFVSYLEVFVLWRFFVIFIRNIFIFYHFSFACESRTLLFFSLLFFLWFFLYFSECNRLVIGINSISYVSGKIASAVLSPGKCISTKHPWNVFPFFLLLLLRQVLWFFMGIYIILYCCLCAKLYFQIMFYDTCNSFLCSCTKNLLVSAEKKEFIHCCRF